MDRVIFIEKIKEIMFYMLFFLLSLFTFQFTVIKILIIAFLFGISIIKIMNGNKFNKFYLFWFMSFLLLNFVYLNYGGIKNILVYKQYLGSYLFWIIIYFFIFNLTLKIEVLKKIGKILEVSFYIGIMLLTIAYINFNYFTIFNLEKIINLTKIERSGQYSKITGFIPAITPMIYTSCFLLSKNIVEYQKKNKIKLWIIFLINTVFIFITMRKALILLYPLIYFFNIIILKKYKIFSINLKKSFFKSFFILGIIVIIIIVVVKLKIINLDGFLEYIIKSFNYFSKEQYGGVSERKEQFKALFEGIKNSPFIGEGIGANVQVNRPQNTLGMYELTYMAKIYHMGLIGFFAWMLLIISLFYKILKLLKKNKEETFLLNYLSGTLGILILCFSNPYLGSFEYDWMLYILLLLIKNVKIDKKYRKEN